MNPFRILTDVRQAAELAGLDRAIAAGVGTVALAESSGLLGKVESPARFGG